MLGPLLMLASGFHGSLFAQPRYRAVILEQTSFTISQARGTSFGQQAGTAYSVFGQNMERAVLWNRSFSNAVVLHPSGFKSSFALGAFDGEQVGFGYRGETEGPHALLWHGDAESVVDLNPPGFMASTAAGVFSGVQVGFGSLAQPEETHALLWRGSPTSFVDLHPRLARAVSSAATCVSETIQGGYAGFKDEDGGRAAMWRGTAESFVDLHPPSKLGPAFSPPYTATDVTSVSCGSLVGNGFVRLANGQRGRAHAMLWYGSATNYVDLNPPGFAWSYGRGVSGNTQVGYGEKTENGRGRALAWLGTADSVIDLHQFLPAASPAFQYSVALAIDEFGNIAGYAGRLVNPGPFEVNQDLAIVWIPETQATPAPLLRIAPWCQASDQVKLQVTGETGRSYSLERSQDLVHWTELLKTNFTTGLFYFQDADAPGSPYGFYRARSGP